MLMKYEKPVGFLEKFSQNEPPQACTTAQIVWKIENWLKAWRNVN
jgi:hypothetical protein